MAQFIIAPQNLSNRMERQLAHSEAAGLETVKRHDSGGLSLALSARVDGSEPQWQDSADGMTFTVGSRSPENRGAFAWGQLGTGATRGEWRLGGDTNGNMQVFYVAESNIASTSFMACAGLATGLTLDIGACYEFVWNGCVFGKRTIFNEVRRLQGGDELTFNAGTLTLARKEKSSSHVLDDAAEPNVDVETAARREVEKLRTAFADLSHLYKGAVRSALSGGYDLRLILALLLDQGISPELFVYGAGQDPDVLIAKRIAELFKLRLVHRRKTPPLETEAEFRTLINRDLIAFDGRRDEGVFNSGADYLDRESRHEGQAVVLNGGLGEIYRNFFYLPDRRFRPDDVISSFFARFDPSAMTNLFEETAYRERLKYRFADALDQPSIPETLSRAEVEALYPLVRGRDWTARETSLSQRFGAFLTPFLDQEIIRGTTSLPIAAKSFGRLEGRMIALLHPELAAVPGADGFPLDGREPPASYRLRHLASLHRPTGLRRRSYRLQHRLRPQQPRPSFLSPESLSTVMDTDFPYMQRLFRMQKIRDWTVYNRIATIELLAQRLDARWSDENS